jgi:hypothetical protein
MTQRREQYRSLTLFESLLLLGVGSTIAAGIAAGMAKLLGRLRPKVPRPVLPVIPPDIRGLSEAEAESRRLEGQDNVVKFSPERSHRDIIRENTLTIFNVSLVGVAVVQFLLGKPLDGFISLGVAVLNIGINVGQELLAERMLEGVVQETRPQATVIREGVIRSIDPGEIVVGDALVVGPGDQFLVDGTILTQAPISIDQAMLTGEGQQIPASKGHEVYAGSFCVTGRAVYEAEKVGDERLLATLVASSEPLPEKRTPLERIVNRVLSVLLVIVFVFLILFAVVYFRLDKTIGIDVDVAISAASVIFSLAPAGLFFMIFLTYVGGTRQLGRKGALVHRARTVESLAHSTSLCLTEASLRTGTDIDLEMLPAPAEEVRVAESRVRQILGDFARTSASTSRAVRAIADLFPGEHRTATAEAPFLSAFGWSALAFDDDDLRGVYVLGEPEILAAQLVQVEDKEEPGPEEEPAARQEAALTAIRGRLSSVGRLFGRGRSAPDETALKEPQKTPGTEDLDPQGLADTETADGSDDETPATLPNPLRGLMGRVTGVLRRAEPTDADGIESEEEESADVEDVVYLLAYLPDLVPLHGPDGLPQIPDDLIPLARLHYTEHVEPETVDTLRSFADSGVRLRVFAAGSPDRVATLIEQANLEVDGERGLPEVTGPELAALEGAELARVVSEEAVYAHVTPEQAAEVVQVLHDGGEKVAVVGDGPSDLQAMRQANLSIARHGSSQAALGVADIVLREDSTQALLSVLDEGQKTVNGLLDVLRLYLTQLSYLALLIPILWFSFRAFPYLSKQGGIIAIATLTLPSLGLSLWAATGVVHTERLGKLLARFALPAAMAITIASVFVFREFLGRRNNVEYAQLALTHMLIFSGLALVILAQPPFRLGGGKGLRRGDLRPTFLVLVILVLFFAAASIPIADQWFGIRHLRHPEDYAAIGLAVLAWVVVVLLVWGVMALVRRLRERR